MLLLIDKPKGITSHDVVDQIRRITRERRVGHAGTLDPNATGLLIVAVGRETTKKLGEITKFTQKEYEAEIFLGEERDTDDSEGKTISINDKIVPTLDEIEKIVDQFEGEIMQTPPIYSAIRVRGKKSYDLARQGKEVELEPRKVTIYENNIINYDYPILTLKISVSAGTYIRSIAHDIGRLTGTGAYLKELRRTRIGEYKIEDALTLEEFQGQYQAKG